MERQESGESSNKNVEMQRFLFLIIHFLTNLSIKMQDESGSISYHMLITENLNSYAIPEGGIQSTQELSPFTH